LVFIRWRNVDQYSSAGKSFQIRAPTTGKALLATVGSRMDGCDGTYVLSTLATVAEFGDYSRQCGRGFRD